MKTRLIFSGVAAILCAGALSSAQIGPQGGIQQRPPQPTTQQPRPTASEERPTTFAGCLYSEDSIPGRTPNVAEKAGVSEDYILADATTAREPNRIPDRPIADAGQPGQRPDVPTAGLASGRMYKVTKIDDDQLKALVGKRVEVTGTIKLDDDRSAGQASARNLPNIEGSAIREVAGGTCPASPNR